MIVQERRIVRATLLPFVLCALLALLGCSNSGNKGLKDKSSDEKVRKGEDTDTDEKPGKDKRPAPADGDRNDEEPSSEGKTLSTWIAQLQDKKLPVGGEKGEGKGTRCEAAEVLGNFDFRNAERYREKAMAALGQALRDSTVKDERNLLRYAAAHALSTYGQFAVPVFLDALKDKDAAVRVRVARTLGDISKWQDRNRFGRLQGHPAAPGEFPVRPESVVPALIAALKDRDAEVRQAAAVSLGSPSQLGKHLAQAESALPALREALRDDENSTVRSWAATALGHLGKPALPALGEALLNDRDYQVRYNAADALRQLGEPGVSVLLTAAKSQNSDTRAIAFSRLGQMDLDARRKAVPDVAALLKEGDAGLRRDVAVLLGNMGDAAGAALPALLGASRAEDSGGEAARTAVQKISKAPRSVAPSLLTFLKDPEPRIRLKAAELLCDLGEGDKECLDCLLELVKRRDTEIRRVAVRLLSRYGSEAKEAVPALLEVMRNDTDDARLAAINALGAIGPEAKDAIQALKALKAQEKEYQKQLADHQEAVKKSGLDANRIKQALVTYEARVSAVQAALKKIEQ